MSELTLSMLEADRRLPCDKAVSRYVIDKAVEDGLWYLWEDSRIICLGSLESVLEELKKKEG